MNNLEEISKQYFRTDLPSLEIGDKVKVITRSILKNEKGEYRLTHSEGIVIAQKNEQQISYNFTVIEEAEKVVIRNVFAYHSPLIVKIQKLGKINQKVWQANL